MFFDLTGRQKVTTWRDAMDAVQTGGGGVLIIDESGRRFFAQAEGFPPPDSFAGDA